MKKILPFIACLTIHCVFAQNTFISSIGTNSYEDFTGVTQTNDGDYIGVGTTEAIDTDFGDIYIAKVNTTGQLVWANDIGSRDSLGYPSDDGIGVINTSDNGFAVIGELDNATGLLKFNSSGTLQWTKQYQEFAYIGSTLYGQGGSGTQILQKSDGGYMFTGNIATTGNGKGVVVSTDDTGKVIWAKAYFNYEYTTITIRDLEKTNDNGYVFISDNPGVSGGTDSTYIVKIDASGNVLWSDYIFSPYANTDGYGVISTSDNGYVVAGTSTSTATITPDCFLFKVDNNGNLLWSKETNNTANSGAETFSVAETSDGGYVIPGDGYNNVTDSNYYYFLKTDKNGNLAWTKTIEKQSGSDLSYIYGIIKTSDNDYVAAGRYFDGYNVYDYDGMLMKLDYNLNACEPEGTAGELKNYGTFVSGNVAVVSDETSSVIDSDYNLTPIPIGDLINVCSALPLKLLSFTGALQTGAIQLKWQTTNETNTAYFGIERSSDGNSFSTIAKVLSTDNISISNYSGIDSNPVPGVNYYRLKMVDMDGGYTYSNIIEINNAGGLGNIIISPNPVNDLLTLRIQSKNSVPGNVELLDMNGKILAQKLVTFSKGTNNIRFNVSGYASGIYIARIILQENVQNMKWIKAQ